MNQEIQAQCLTRGQAVDGHTLAAVVIEFVAFKLSTWDKPPGWLPRCKLTSQCSDMLIKVKKILYSKAVCPSLSRAGGLFLIFQSRSDIFSLEKAMSNYLLWQRGWVSQEITQVRVSECKSVLTDVLNQAQIPKPLYIETWNFHILNWTSFHLFTSIYLQLHLYSFRWTGLF